MSHTLYITYEKHDCQDARCWIDRDVFETEDAARKEIERNPALRLDVQKFDEGDEEYEQLLSFVV